jgi:hypothetical protein
MMIRNPDKIDFATAELINHGIWPNALNKSELVDFIGSLKLTNQDKQEVMYMVEYVTNSAYSKRDYHKRKPFYEEVLGIHNDRA